MRTDGFGPDQPEYWWNKIIVYPEKKEFQDVVAAPYSMLPLKPDTSLSSIDLTGYTIPKLTMVKVNTIFAYNESNSAEAVVWKYTYDDDYTVTAAADGRFDLNYCTCYNTSAFWKMIFGTADQLDADKDMLFCNSKDNSIAGLVHARDLYGGARGNPNSLHVGQVLVIPSA